MKILSIHDGHNASAAVFDGVKILACVSEERLNREKFYWGWPALSIDYVLKASQLALDDVEAVTVSHLNLWDYFKRKTSSPANYSWRPKTMLGHFYHIFLAARRELKVRSLFSGHGRKKFFFCDHHLAHAASAYYFSGFKESLVVTMDAQGDGLSHTAYTVKDGQWELITRGESMESPGIFYAALTEGLGFRSNRHEGKIVGLAAFGNPQNINSDKKALFIQIASGHLHFKRRAYVAMKQAVKDLLDEGFSRADVAAFGQQLLEELVIKYINKLCQLTGADNLSLGGGVFANVKLNQKIIEQCPIKQIFIQPAMGDEGLVLGSAAYFLDKKASIKLNQPMANVYLGRNFDNDEIEGILKAQNYQYEILSDMPAKVASLINEKQIIGWFDGRMEFGPRALGSRSILADPRDPKINDILNQRLKRSEFMPFAPSVLAEQGNDIFDNLEPAIHSAEFMTITFNVRPEWSQKIKAVVHVDNTARPQLVRQDKNPAYWSVINEFYKLTGIPLVVNTSYNMHEEPIVCTPQDALRAFDAGAVDHAVLNNKFLVSRQK